MKTSTITAREFNQKIDNNEAAVLTVEKAKSLKGKKIAWTYFGYSSNEQVVYEMTVGEIVSSWDFHKNEKVDGFESRTAEWQTWMRPDQIQDEKDKLILLDEKGENNNHIFAFTGRENCFDEPTFTCSDSDRSVFFIEL